MVCFSQGAPVHINGRDFSFILTSCFTVVLNNFLRASHFDLRNPQSTSFRFLLVSITVQTLAFLSEPDQQAANISEFFPSVLTSI